MKKTLKDFMGEATRGDGRKFNYDSWGKNYFEPIFLVNDRWHGLYNDVLPENYASDRGGWYEYAPEKKKIERWMWSDDKGYMMTGLFSDQEIEEMKDLQPAHKNLIKLEWSRTEFEI